MAALTRMGVILPPDAETGSARAQHPRKGVERQLCFPTRWDDMRQILLSKRNIIDMPGRW
jgi:hypothetical protein